MDNAISNQEARDTNVSSSATTMNKLLTKRKYNMNVTQQESSTSSTTKQSKKKRKTEKKQGQKEGRWTAQEHQAFLEGLEQYGREWKKVAEKIPTRSSTQIRSHAQKYFSKRCTLSSSALGMF